MPRSPPPADAAEDRARRGRARGPAPAAAIPGRRAAGVVVTHPDRVLWPEAGVTKGELADYLAAVAPRMLAHVAGRPLSLLRAPQGLGGKSFFQRHPTAAGRRAPEALRVVTPRGEARPLLAVEDAAGLVALAQMGVVEIHPWGARLGDLERPDRLVLDLDPAEDVGFAAVAAAARALRGRLEALGLVPFCKATGGKGLHLVVPLVPRAGWAEVKGLARTVCEAVARGAPDRFTLNARKAARIGRVYLDDLRNDRGSSAVAPWSPRAKPAAPVAVPLAWEVLDDGPPDPAASTLRAVLREGGAAAGPDPWAGFEAAARPLTAALLRRAAQQG